jgi:enoyl-CoA hydratase/carnithine racemase
VTSAVSIDTPDALVVTQSDGVLRLRFNQPEKLNALTSGMMASAASIIEAIDGSVRVVVIAGTGRAFSSGADVSTSSELAGPATIRSANRLIRAMYASPSPVVASVQGPAVGVGCSIALAADFVIAAESAYFLLAFAAIALMPDGGATALLPAAIGRARALRMAMLGERISAATAERWGIIAYRVRDDALNLAVQTLVDRLRCGPTMAYAKTKLAINAAAIADLDAVLNREFVGQSSLFATTDYVEGVTAFAERRPPRFQGR